MLNNKTAQPESSLNPCVSIEIESPYVIYFGDVEDKRFAKTGLGLIEWRRELCIGQVRLPECKVSGGIADLTIAEAVKAGAKSMIIGVAPSGGGIPRVWLSDLVEAARAGMDIVSGMHSKLTSFPELVLAAEKSGAKLVDVRVPPPNLPIGTGEKRPGMRLLTVGTDCAVGKKYTALAIEKEMKARGMNAEFRATGQTGIMIAGCGIPIDAVVSDFISGAAELISPANDPGHWDIIEGQGALTNPSYAGVSLGLLHGSRPDALVLCHDPIRTYHLGSAASYTIVSLNEAIELHLKLARRVNEAVKFIGVSINLSMVRPEDRSTLYKRYTDETGLPVVDPIIDGAGALVDRLLSEDWT